jgi:hypothetical protein
MMRIITIAVFLIFIIAIPVVVYQVFLKDRLINKTVTESIEGTYELTTFKIENNAQKQVMKGTLEINGGRYQFTPDNSQNIDKSSFFGYHPRGTYIVDLSDDSFKSQNITTLADNQQIGFITLTSSESSPPVGMTTAPVMADVMRYLLLNDRNAQKIYFHSMGDEIMLWTIKKSW